MSGGDSARELDQLTRLLGSGSDVHDDFLFVPQEGASYLAGSAVQVIGQLGGRDTTSGFWVPSADPASHAFIGTYMTLEEYLPGIADALDLNGVADEHRRLSLIRAAVAVNRIVGNAERRAELTNGFSSVLAPDVRERFLASMHANTGGLGRLIVAPQPVLLSLRWLIGVPPHGTARRQDHAASRHAVRPPCGSEALQARERRRFGPGAERAVGSCWC